MYQASRLYIGQCAVQVLRKSIKKWVSNCSLKFWSQNSEKCGRARSHEKYNNKNTWPVDPQILEWAALDSWTLTIEWVPNSVSHKFAVTLSSFSVLLLDFYPISWINSITNIQKQGGVHGIEEEGLVAVVLASKVSWCAEQGLLVFVVVEGDEGRSGVCYRYGVMNICKMTVMNHLPLKFLSLSTTHSPNTSLTNIMLISLIRRSPIEKQGADGIGVSICHCKVE